MHMKLDFGDGVHKLVVGGKKVFSKLLAKLSGERVFDTHSD